MKFLIVLIPKWEKWKSEFADNEINYDNFDLIIRSEELTQQNFNPIKVFISQTLKRDFEEYKHLDWPYVREKFLDENPHIDEEVILSDNGIPLDPKQNLFFA